MGAIDDSDQPVWLHFAIIPHYGPPARDGVERELGNIYPNRLRRDIR